MDWFPILIPSSSYLISFDPIALTFQLGFLKHPHNFFYPAKLFNQQCHLWIENKETYFLHSLTEQLKKIPTFPVAPTLSLLYLLSPVFLGPQSCIVKKYSMSTPGTERALRSKSGACQCWHQAPQFWVAVSRREPKAWLAVLVSRMIKIRMDRDLKAHGIQFPHFTDVDNEAMLVKWLLQITPLIDGSSQD